MRWSLTGLFVPFLDLHMGSYHSLMDFNGDFCFGECCFWGTRLRKAVLKDDIQLISKLSAVLGKRQPRLNDVIIGEHREPPMLLAVQLACQDRLSTETVRAMLKLGFRADVYAEDEIGMTPLYTAARHNRPDLIELLLTAGADPNRTTGCQLSPLFIASASGFIECTRILLKGGANANNLSASLKGTALHMAASSGHKDLETVCQLLLDYGCVISMKNGVGRTALNSVCGTRRDVGPAVNFLLDRGADIDEQDNFGMTPLMRAVNVGNRTVARILIKRGANMDIKDKNGRTAADIELIKKVRSNSTESLLCSADHSSA